MTTRAVKIVNVENKHADSDDLGAVHISGASLSGTETLCGNVDTFTGYEDTIEPVTCEACAEIYRSIKASRKKLKFDC